MKEETKSFIAGCITVVILVMSMVSCSKTKAQLATEMVKSGADPLTVNCLLYDASSSVCAILASKK
jgi:hypothetical protein